MSTASFQIQINVTAEGIAGRHREPITCGIPFLKGALFDPSCLRLVDDSDQVIQLQTKVLDRWSDGSVRWILLDWQANVKEKAHYLLSCIDRSTKAAPHPFKCEETNSQVSLHTNIGIFDFKLGKRETLFSLARSSEVEPARSIDLQLLAEDQQGKRYQPLVEAIELEESGPVRTCVALRGKLVSCAESSFLADLIVRLHFYSGASTVRTHVTVRNPRRADHPGGLWDLGNGGSIYFRDVSLVLACPPSQQRWNGKLSVAPQQAYQSFEGDCQLYQDSSGGDNWKSSNHINRQREVPLTFRGFRLNIGNEVQQGSRATPAIMLKRDSLQIGLAMPEFWQNFPKCIEVEGNRLILRLFPKQFADLHELQGGEQKTHLCYLAFGPDPINQEPLDWCRAPVIASCTPEWYSQCQVIPFLTPRSSDPHADYLQLVDSAIEGSDTFEKKREIIDEYGWRHFGDIYGDHEAVFHRGPAPLVSHYNNQYDAIAGMGIQYLRSVDPRWLRMMSELTAHVIDIDIYHTDKDKSAYNHGLFWHTFHYVDADTGTHRSYPRLGKVPPHNRPVPGGGPANEQNYATGLMLHYFLTGDLNSKKAAIELAQWIIDMDDGNKTVFRWVCRKYTGLASQSGAPWFHGPGRGGANSISALLDGHRLTGEQRFLDKAEQLIRRCVHPCDDIDMLNLLNTEKRWFYTMFLQSLGKYLHYKVEREELDDRYAYARESLLHYARWMADHEYPYLSKPEILEYPTETWAAQDMRKSEIFKLAALCSDGAERQHFIERAKHFFEYSIQTLQSMPTRSLCRPVVLMLNFGFMQNWFEQHPKVALPQPIQSHDFGSPSSFVPQKTIALKRAKWIVGIVGTFFLTGSVWLAYKMLF